MSSTAELALAWAARGYRVFPLSPNSRRPVWADWDWSKHATTNPETIRAWWATGDWNIGCATGNGLVVIDIDNKDGKDGMATWVDHGGVFDTLAVRTTTGGLHLYFRGDAASTVQRLGSGVDSRGEGGYVVAPGSTIDGKPYQVTIERPLRELPTNTAAALAPREAAATGLVELDSETAIALATAWLQREPPAIEGQGGDAHTYRVACDLRDRGVSEATALALLIEHWNERCLPPWDAGELDAKVRNAFLYGQNAAGSKHPGVLLGTEGGAPVVLLPVQQEEPPAGERVDVSPFTLGNVMPLAELRPRPWVYRRMLLRGDITALVAAGAAGKSLTTISVAIALALGADFMGFENATPGQPQNSIICNAEDHRDEMARRLYACCAAWNVDPARVIPHIALASGRDPAGRLILARKASGTVEINVEDVSKLLSLVRFQNIAMLGIDPLVKLQSGLSENDNSEMNWPLDVLQHVAVEGGCAVLLSHHVGKTGPNTSIVGNADASRGATNIINSCRAAFTLAGPTEDDTSRYNLTPQQRAALVRMDDAKMNLVLRAMDRPVWMEKRTIKLATGDEVGALVPADLRNTLAVGRERLGRMFYEEMLARGTASLALGMAAEILRDNDPIYGNLTKAIVQSRLERFFTEDVEDGQGHTLHLTPGEKRTITIR